MKDSTKRLLDLARGARMTDGQREEQRRSFAFGNSNIENEHITRDLINKEAETIRRTTNAPGTLEAIKLVDERLNRLERAVADLATIGRVGTLSIDAIKVLVREQLKTETKAWETGTRRLRCRRP